MSADEREKISFSELDRRRRDKDRGDHDRRPRGAAGEARSQEATAAYLKEVGKLFTDAKGGAQGEALAKAVEAAHGSPDLAAACEAYREALGMPEDAALLSLFLDAEAPEIVAQAVRAFADGLEGGRIQISRGVRSQLRVLAQGSDDDVAYEAEELLARL